MSRVSFDTIVAVVALEAGLAPDDLRGQCRHRKVARPRQRVSWLASQIRPDLSQADVGRRLGGRDHTTILHGVRNIEALIAHDPEERETCFGLRLMLTGERGQTVERPEFPALQPESLKLLRAALGGGGLLECADRAGVDPALARERLREMVARLAQVAGAVAVYPRVSVAPLP